MGGRGGGQGRSPVKTFPPGKWIQCVTEAKCVVWPEADTRAFDSQQVWKSQRLQWLLETSTILKGDAGAESCEQQGCKNMNTGITNVL